jgi:hypothetical protein
VSVLVNLAAFDDMERHRTFLARQAGRAEAGSPTLSTSQLRLEPTARSQLR